jgi:endonuclease III related protein
VTRYPRNPVPRPPKAADDSPAARLRLLYEHLVAAYGPQSWWPAKTPLEVIIGAYLTQNTSWRAVERSIENLRLGGALTLEGLRTTPEEQLRLLIRPSGYMVRKAAAILAFVAFLDREYSGSLDRLASQPIAILRQQLLELPGVGPETADAILLYALGAPVMVVDEYLRRVAARHGLTGERPRYAALQQLAEAAFAGDDRATHLQHFNEFHALIVEAGKRHCGPKAKCEGCPLAFDLAAATDQRKAR